MLQFLKILQIVWIIIIIGCLAILGGCLVLSPGYQREAFYAAWVGLSRAVIPVAPAIIAPWLLGYAAFAIAIAPFVVIEEIKKRLINVPE